jgi:tetratricopeptide (TPR) repeat protein
MNKRNLQLLSSLCAIGVALSGCSGFSKMFKDASKVSYSVTPNPLQDNGDSVQVSISVKYPEKYFSKKAVVSVTPTLKCSDGKEIPLKQVTLVGEKASGNGTKIAYSNGGSFNYTDKVAYQDAMKMDELDLKATLENKKKDFPPMKIADGTIITAKLLQNDDKLLIGKDNFQHTTLEKDTTHIYYVISQSNVRPAEMNSAEMKKFKEFIDKGSKEGYTWDDISVDAYASPDGETAMNQNLAGDRAKTAIKATRAMLKEMRIEVETTDKKGRPRKEKVKVDEKLSDESFYKVGVTGLDWDGFKTEVQQSQIKDKDLILRVLSMYSDHDQRMKEIKNMSATYTVLADKILPRLRRAIIILNAEKKGRTDAQLSQLATSHPDSLNLEELLYSATLTKDMNTKLSIYKAAEKQNPGDWRAANDIGYAEMMLNKVSDAEAEFHKADGLSANNPVVQNNLGVVARWKGDRKTAMDYFKKASSAGPDVAYNMGLVDIQNGNYTDAVGNVGSNNTFNAALAKVLNNDVAGAKTTLDAANDQDAIASYLMAVISARSGDKSNMISNLKAAINKDASLKQMASTDCEFIKFKDDADFKSAIQ